ncbi:MAG: methyltransferase domain-containing protein [Piscinibacter sp.]|nr:methyltransferase domain-containing protein [Piscinibacter sp.]
MPFPADPATALKRRLAAGWAGGDYAVIGATLQVVAENLVEAVDLRAGERVLDVAAGTGNASLAAARRFAHVTSTDLQSLLLDKGRERARAEALPVTFIVADAEELPFADASFDVVLSTFGAMYAPDQAKAARELRRVLKPGGRIGLANWTPDGVAGRLLQTLAAHVPPPPGLPPPTRWGVPAELAALLDLDPACLRCARRSFHFRYRSALHWVQVFRDFHGPTRRAFAALDAPGQRTLERELGALLDAANAGGAGSLVVAADYLEAVIRPDGPVPISSPVL